jgi:hypothetical protein
VTHQHTKQTKPKKQERKNTEEAKSPFAEPITIPVGDEGVVKVLLR